MGLSNMLWCNPCSRNLTFDPSALTNYRQITKCPFLSNNLEQVVYTQLRGVLINLTFWKCSSLGSKQTTALNLLFHSFLKAYF